MNNFNSQQYNSSLSLVKALDLNNNNVCGFYFVDECGKWVYEFGSVIFPRIEINPYTVCRNSGIHDKNGKFIFEYDLLKLTHSMKNTCYGFLVWDEFYKSWKIRRRTDRTAYSNLDDWTIESVGNIVLYDSDLEIIFKQEKEEDSKESFIDNSYCKSKFRK